MAQLAEPIFLTLFFILSSFACIATASPASDFPEASCGEVSAISGPRLVQTLVESKRSLEPEPAVGTDQGTLDTTVQPRDIPSKTQATSLVQTQSYSGGMSIGMIVAMIVVSFFLLVLGIILFEVSSDSKLAKFVSDPRTISERTAVAAARPESPAQSFYPFSTSTPVQLAPRPLSEQSRLAFLKGASSGSLLSRLWEPSPFMLCGQELVVPEGTECVLLLPSLVSQSVKSGVIQIPVKDSKELQIFRADYYTFPQSDGTRLALYSATGEETFAFCRNMSRVAGAPTMALYSRHFETSPFGFIRADDNGLFELVTDKNQRLTFKGDFEGNFNVVDSKGSTLALSEKVGDSRRLRIGPGTDAGLMVIAYLATDLLFVDAALAATRYAAC